MAKQQEKESTYDITFYVQQAGKPDITKDNVMKFLKDVGKKWGFQLEKGEESGKLHWQCRVQLKVRDRISALVKQCPYVGHWSITSAANKDNLFYVIKFGTRIDGPWTDSDPEPKYVPIQVRMVVEANSWYLWQQQFVKMLMGKDINDNVIPNLRRNTDGIVIDTKHVNALVAHGGCEGKSLLAQALRCGIVPGIVCRSIPMITDYKDVMQAICDMPTGNLYIIDMPRALPKDRLSSIYGAIEIIKGGYAFDTRNHFREKEFDCPHVWVFTNSMPDISLLTEERWKFWGISKISKTLVPYATYAAESLLLK